MQMKTVMSEYIVKIRKNVYVEQDPRKTCKNYPTEKFSSYAECDTKFMRDTVEEAAPGLNLTPPWLTRVSR